MGRRPARGHAGPGPHRPGRGLRGRAAALLLAVVLTGCGGGGQEDLPVDPGTLRLDAAVAQLNTSRGALLELQDDLVEGATRLDDVDEAAAAGQRTATRTARERAASTTPAAAAALKEMPGALSAYRQALAELTGAAEVAPLDRAQRGLLAALGTTGSAEIAAGDRLRTTGNGAWAGYARLDRLSRTWLERSTAGWYRDAEEGAAAYAVLVTDLRPALERARAALRTADLSRRAAAGRVSTALREADAALAPLRAPSGPPAAP